MKLIRIDSPSKYVGGEWTPEDFSKFNEKELARSQPDLELVIYWYSTGNYCGAGQLLMKSPHGWGLHDCGHCSCDGPTAYVHPEWRASLEEVARHCSTDLLKDVQPLLDCALEEAGTAKHQDSMKPETDKLTYEALREQMEPVAQQLLDEYQSTKQLLVDVTQDPEAHVQAMCFATMTATQGSPKIGGLLIAYLLLERLERDEQAEQAGMERSLQE